MTHVSPPTALLARLRAALARGHRADANAAVADLLAADAPLGAQWRSCAMLALHHGEMTLAIRAIEKFVNAMGGSAAARQERGVLLARAGRLIDAREALAAIDERAVDAAGLRFVRASVALDLGDLEEARRLLADVVAMRPAAGTAWLALATAGGLRDDAAQQRALLAARDAVMRAPSGERAAWFYAVGRVHADRGDVDPAFAAVASGAAERRTALRYDRAADAANARLATAGRVPPTPYAKSRGDLPILVTGLPRSGTTLVEQILSSHSAVGGGGEINALRLVAQDVGGVSAQAASAFAGSATAPMTLYRHLLAERFGSGRIVDKSLTTSRFLGLAMSIAPDMPVIWVRRDPLDCAWSCFRSHFVEGAAWSLDLGDMAHHFRLEDALHAHWSTVLGSRLLTVDYAALVGDPTAWTRRMLDHCGLTDEAAPYAPHLTRRAVTTASVAQVRRPINRDGLGAAEPYRQHLAPFLEAYQAT